MILLHLHKFNEPNYFTVIFNTISEETELETFNITHTNNNEVRKIILGVKSDCATGDDGIPIRYIKPVVDDITSPMANIIKNCIDKNVFPTSWKKARVRPIPKIDNPKDVTKYRPISVLCVLTKVFERLILTQLCNYIKVKASYNLTQSGFRKVHSTSILSLKLRDDIKREMNTSEVTDGILLEFSKAFETTLREKCPNTELFLVCMFLYSD